MKIECQSLSIAYENHPLFREMSCSFPSGSFVLISGRSGAGKSSWLKAMAGLSLPNEGKIIFEDQGSISCFDSNSSLAENNAFRFKHISYLHQDVHLPGHWLVGQYLSFVDSNREEQVQILSELGLSADILKQSCSKLSGGEAQRVGLARVFLERKAIVLIDEPSAHLDDYSTHKLIELLRTRMSSSTCIIVTHDHRWFNQGFIEREFGGLVNHAP